MKKIVLASRNPKKVKELSEILRPYDIEIVSLDLFPDAPEVEETGSTFEENAALKAEAISEATGLPTLADDSGLCVNILNAAPGVYSARYAGENATDAENIDYLLENLKGFKEHDREAKFVCVLAFSRPKQKTSFFSGETFGRIIVEKEGTGGFGYDPVFFSDELQTTFALASSEEKNRISHRGRALEKFIAYIK